MKVALGRKTCKAGHRFTLHIFGAMALQVVGQSDANLVRRLKTAHASGAAVSAREIQVFASMV
jgi:hypothetical protein